MPASRCDSGAFCSPRPFDDLEERRQRLGIAALPLQLLALLVNGVVGLGAKRHPVVAAAARAEQQHGKREERGDLSADSHAVGNGIEWVAVRRKFRSLIPRLKL